MTDSIPPARLRSLLDAADRHDDGAEALRQALSASTVTVSEAERTTAADLVHTYTVRREHVAATGLRAAGFDGFLAALDELSSDDLLLVSAEGGEWYCVVLLSQDGTQYLASVAVQSDPP